MEKFDVAVIGAGAAGISAAVALARSKRSVLVLNAGKPRNAAASGAHNVMGMEGSSPQEILRQSREKAEAYGVQFSSSQVQELSGSKEEGFLVNGGERTFSARRILLATGLKDVLPDIPGLSEAWGKSALHCPYCHGWEVRDRRIAIIGIGMMSAHQAKLFSQLSEHVTYINHTPEMLSAEDRQVLTALSIPIIDAQLESVDVDTSGQLDLLHLSTGQKLDMDAVVVMTRLQANAELYEALGGVLCANPLGNYIAVDQMGATDIPGVYAAGNVAELSAMVLAAAASGVSAGAGINYDLIAQKIESLIS